MLCDHHLPCQPFQTLCLNPVQVSDFGLSHVMDAISAANGEAPQPTAPHAAAAANTSQEHGATAHACSDSSDTVAAADAAAAVSGCDVGSAGGLSLCQQPVQPRFGALSHAAPELIRGQLLSKASDVYSIGVLLWELLTGQVSREDVEGERQRGWGVVGSSHPAACFVLHQ